MNLSSELPNYPVPVTFPCSSSFLHNHQANPSKSSGDDFRSYKDGIAVKRKEGIIRGWLLYWIQGHQTLTRSFLQFLCFPYIGFLYFITKSKSAPKLTLFGFYFSLAFVGATSDFLGIYGKDAYHDNGASASCNVSVRVLETLASAFAHFEPGPVPPGIYGEKYGTSLANVDWLAGGTESLLTLPNLFIVLVLRQALRKTEDAKESTSSSVPYVKKQKKPYI